MLTLRGVGELLGAELALELVVAGVRRLVHGEHRAPQELLRAVGALEVLHQLARLRADVDHAADGKVCGEHYHEKINYRRT